eukprot:951747-Amphidinium_carterae.1
MPRPQRSSGRSQWWGLAMAFSRVQDCAKSTRCRKSVVSNRTGCSALLAHGTDDISMNMNSMEVTVRVHNKPCLMNRHELRNDTECLAKVIHGTNSFPMLGFSHGHQ